MKKYFLLALVSMIFFACSSGLSWEETKELNTIEGYQEFIENNPESEFTEIAEFKLDTLITEKDEEDWEIAKQNDTKESYQKYIDNHPEGIYISDAEKQLNWAIDDEIWEEYLEKNTVLEYYNFCQKYGSNKNYNQAKSKINELLKKDFETDYPEILEFFTILADDQSFNAIDGYIQDNLLYIEDNEEWEEEIDTTYIVDSVSYNKVSINYVLADLEKIYKQGGTIQNEYDEYGEYVDEYLEDYTLDYVPNGLIFTYYGECEEYHITFVYEKTKLFLKEVYVVYYYCDI